MSNEVDAVKCFYVGTMATDALDTILKQKNAVSFFASAYGYTNEDDLHHPSLRLMGVINPTTEDLLYLELLGAEPLENSTHLCRVALNLYKGNLTL